MENIIDTKINTEVDKKIDESKIDTKVDETKTETEDKKFIQITQEDLDELITKRLERASKKAEIEKVEAEKLAKMSEAERQTALFNKEKAKMEDERKQFQKEKMENEVLKQLSSKNLPTVFSGLLVADDAETALNNIKTFETQWQQAIEKAVDGKLKGNTPKAGSGTTQTYTMEDVAKMTQSEINENWEVICKINK